MNKLKSRRGFSLVELMVVVAIMGTLAAIAIPAYNEYRKSAKKTAYKSDLGSLHKGWMAFGVELDSFCERETNPTVASIGTVGMQSLLTSKLYGEANGQVTKCNWADNGGNTCGTTTTYVVAPATCANPNSTDCTAGSPATEDFQTYGPGKDNFIGFGNVASGTDCSTAIPSVETVQHKKTSTTNDTNCELNVTSYRMGVGGHVAGEEYYGANMNNVGVLKDKIGVVSDIFGVGKLCF